MIIKKNQTLLDFTAQFAGDVSEWFNVAIANGIGITDEVAPGTELSVVATDRRVTKYFAESIWDITSIIDFGQLGGIGYMQIGTNFIVS